jgi:hypothetical protein
MRVSFAHARKVENSLRYREALIKALERLLNVFNGDLTFTELELGLDDELILAGCNYIFKRLKSIVTLASPRNSLQLMPIN